MINIIDGDILNAKERVIVHQVNCQGVMGSGIAKQIREKYPIVYEEYKELYNHHKSNNYRLLGENQIVKVDSDKYVVNIFGQEYYGRDGKKYTNYNALAKGFSDLLLKTHCDIAIPYNIGCGYGGGDWDKVFEMLVLLSVDFKHNINIYFLYPAQINIYH